MMQDSFLNDEDISKGKIMHQTLNKQALTMDKKVLYVVTSATTFRDMGTIINEVSFCLFYSDKRRAVERLRKEEEGLPVALSKYERYRNGDSPVFTDFCLSMEEYRDYDGAFIITDGMAWVNFSAGKLEDNRNNPYFETF